MSSRRSRNGGNTIELHSTDRKVVAKSARLDLLLNVAIARGDYAHIHFLRLI